MNSDYVDYGDGQVHQAEGLARIDQLAGGNVNLAFWRLKTIRVPGQMDQHNEVALNVVIHVSALPDIIAKLTAVAAQHRAEAPAAIVLPRAQ